MSIKSYFEEVIAKSLLTLFAITLIVLVPYFLVEVEPYRLLSVVVVNIFAFLFVVWFIGLSKIEKDFIRQLVKRKKGIFSS